MMESDIKNEKTTGQEQVIPDNQQPLRELYANLTPKKNHSKKKLLILIGVICAIVSVTALAIVFPILHARKNNMDAVAVRYRGDCPCLDAEYGFAIGLKSDGRAITTKNIYASDSEEDRWLDRGQWNVDDWKDLIAVACGERHTVGLKSDGTVVAIGENGGGQCDVETWTNIKAIAASGNYTAGLGNDGRVHLAGYGYMYSLKEAENWTDIIAISAGWGFLAGLRSDGTVVLAGAPDEMKQNVAGWSDIVAVSAGMRHVIGLKSDGTVTADRTFFEVGGMSKKSEDGTVAEEKYYFDSNEYGQCEVSGWTDIVAISAGEYHTVGLKADGSVVVTEWKLPDKTKDMDWAELEDYWHNQEKYEVDGWNDIVAIKAGQEFTLGLRSDGTVVFAGPDRYRDLFRDFTELKLP